MTDGDPYDGRVDQDDGGVESRDDGGPASDEPTGSRRLWWVWTLLAVTAVLLGAYASTRS